MYSCKNCGFSFIGNPSTHFEDIYDEKYYQGKGADPLVNYIFDLNNPELTVKQYEWEGITEIFTQSITDSNATWLDFGCGTGGLVRYARNIGINIVGYDTGFGAQIGIQSGIPILSQVTEKYDFITAIEVLEHCIDPIATLNEISNFLKPNGILFITTGNSAPFKLKFNKWAYIQVPDVHVSFFEPRTMEYAFEKVGLVPDRVGYLSGYTNIIRYKILKTLHINKQNIMEKILPWTLLSKFVNQYYAVSAFPRGIKQ